MRTLNLWRPHTTRVFSSSDFENSCFLFPKSNDTYYNDDDDLVLQVQQIIPLFEHIHPGCELIFMFDNSQNHHKKSPDGLCANVLNLSDGGKNTPKLRNGWYIRNGQRIEYQMQTENGMQKGLRTILQDRELWTPGLKLDCGKELHDAADSAAEDNEQLPRESTRVIE